MLCQQSNDKHTVPNILSDDMQLVKTCITNLRLALLRGFPGLPENRITMYMYHCV